MKKKRFCFGFVLSLCLNAGLGFAGNMQRVYSVEDPVYQRVDELCQRTGVIGPTNFSPMNARALEIALDRIDASALSSKDRAELETLYSVIKGGGYLLEEKNFKLDLDLGVNLMLNVAPYSDFDYVSGLQYDVVRREEQLVPYRFEAPSISLAPKLFFGDNVFLEVGYYQKDNPSHMFESSFGWLLTDYNGLSFFGSNAYTSFANEEPTRAGLSAGNDYFNIMLGRFGHSIGSGITGNLVIGNNFNYQEIATLSFMSNCFAYNISVTRFDNLENTSSSNVVIPSRNEFTGEQQMRVVHHFDFNILKKVRLSLDMGTIYESSSVFDMRFFYPFVLGHNYYNYTNALQKEAYDEANNIMALNLELALPLGFKLTAQFVIDQFQTYFENENSVPAAYGALANLRYSSNLGKGRIGAYFEFVYTSPYLYLNGKYDEDTVIDYNLDYFVGYQNTFLSDFNFSGYRFGPDSVVFALGADYEGDVGWTLGGEVMYKASGEKRVSLYSTGAVKVTYYDMANAYIEQDYTQRATGFLSTGWKDAEHLIQVKVNGSYTFEHNIIIYALAGLNTYFNYDLQVGVTKLIPQLSVGFKWAGL